MNRAGHSPAAREGGGGVFELLSICMGKSRTKGIPISVLPLHRTTIHYNKNQRKKKRINKIQQVTVKSTVHVSVTIYDGPPPPPLTQPCSKGGREDHHK